MYYSLSQVKQPVVDVASILSEPFSTSACEVIFSPKQVRHSNKFVKDINTDEYIRLWIFDNMYSLKSKHTDAEDAVLLLLHRLGIEFIYQAPFVFQGRIYFADFYLPCNFLILEIDGGYHSRKKQQCKDAARDTEFCHENLKTIRIPNEVALNTEELLKVFAEARIIKIEETSKESKDKKKNK